MGRRRYLETVIEMDKTANDNSKNLNENLKKQDSEVKESNNNTPTTKMIIVKEADDCKKLIIPSSNKEYDALDKTKLISQQTNSTKYFWTARSAHYKALLLARKANAESRKNRRLIYKKRLDEEDKWKYETDSYYNSAEYEKENRETCREFCFITLGSLILSFFISFLFFYFFQDYDGLLTGILFL